MNRTLDDWYRVSKGWPTDSKVRNVRDLNALLADLTEMARLTKMPCECVPGGTELVQGGTHGEQTGR